MAYQPKPPPTGLPPGLAEWLIQNNQAVADNFNSAQDFLLLKPQGKPPAKLKDGMIAYADGANWDPGCGNGPYMYINGVWSLMACGCDANPGGAGSITGGSTGPDPHFSDVVLLCHFNTDVASITPDNSPQNHAVSYQGSTATSSTESKFGGSSARVGTSTSSIVLVTDKPTNFKFDAGDFTIEGWDRRDNVSVTNVLTSFNNSTTGAANFEWVVYVASGALHVQFIQDTSYTIYTLDGGSLTNATWYYWKVYRAGNTGYLQINNTIVDTVDLTGVTLNYPPGSAPQLSINGVSLPSDTQAGYMDDFRITKGVGRVGSAPTTAFSNS